MQALRLDHLEHLRRGHEPPPVVGARRQPAQHVFRRHDPEGKAAQSAVEGGEQHLPALGPGTDDIGDKGWRVVHVLDDLQRQHHVEALSGLDQLGDGGDAVVDLQPHLLGMDFRDRDVCRRGVDPGDLRAQPRERLAHQSAAAADVEDAQPRQRVRRVEVAVEVCRNLFGDEAQPGRVDLVQRAEVTVRVPPARRHGGELFDLARVDRVARAGARLLCIPHACPAVAASEAFLYPLCQV